ncbi:MAG: radical SAM protein [Patescibacteria group bacterium]
MFLNNSIFSKYRQSLYKALVFKNSFNFGRFFNLLKTALNFKKKRLSLDSFPRYATVEITNVCNLSCPHCPTGTKLSTRPKSFMSLGNFKKVADELADYVFGMNLGPNGEPFLHPDIFAMIDYLNTKKVSSFLSSNFNSISEENIKKIVSSKLKIINIGIDGATAESYSQYRRGGDFDKVINNLKLLVAERNKQKSKWPFIIWQFLVMKTNEAEIDSARKLAREIGVDQIAFDMPFIPLPEYWFFGRQSEIDSEAQAFFPSQEQYRLPADDSFIKNCHLPWKEIHVLVDGTVVPCCRLVEMGINFGNILDQPLKEIWNNKFYQQIRESLKIQKKDSCCSQCLRSLESLKH